MSAKNIHTLLITGSTGLVGSRFVELFKNTFSIVTIGRNNVDIKINLTSEEEVTKTINLSDADAVINFAAYTNVDEAEKEKGNTKGEVYILNVLLPFWLAKSCQTSGKKLYHISTDYVFDGKQTKRPYTEEDIPKPVDCWYSITKYEGEKKVAEGFSRDKNFAVVRVSYPYSGVYKRKLDIARAIVEKLREGQTYLGVLDQNIKPTNVDDIAQALKFLLENNATGIYHVAGNYSPQKYITPIQFAQKIAEEMDLDASLIRSVSFKELSKKRVAPRPQHTWLDTKKIESMGFQITNIDQALNRFKQQFTYQELKNLPF